eukprot:CAMPEP_0172383878 /NCGR_PEP_ID=MMETSP1061-20121228/1689_1 /TAXON_ID=37318 /ORGANISM="Pseudo-nitzschia pungens, Strain cf. pungens" /LENGTH=130 /DNA_ID=CAMNT_0013112273 /DNA_START=1593 /DNA_END=1982 /DNA_ORIENTATION=+
MTPPIGKVKETKRNETKRNETTQNETHPSTASYHSFVWSSRTTNPGGGEAHDEWNDKHVAANAKTQPKRGKRWDAMQCNAMQCEAMGCNPIQCIPMYSNAMETDWDHECIHDNDNSDSASARMGRNGAGW